MKEKGEGVGGEAEAGAGAGDGAGKSKVSSSWKADQSISLFPSLFLSLFKEGLNPIGIQEVRVLEENYEF